MQVIATIKKGSSVWKDWRALNRLGGNLCGAQFRWVNGEYVATEVSGEPMRLLMLSPSAIVEMMAVAVPDTLLLQQMYGDRMTPTVMGANGQTSVMPAVVTPQQQPYQSPPVVIPKFAPPARPVAPATSGAAKHFGGAKKGRR